MPSAGKLRLGNILPKARFYRTQDILVDSCCGDSRHCRQGDLFAALVGPTTDGHEYVPDAIERGATSVLSERLLPHSVPTCIVNDTREAYGRICHALVDNPCNDMLVAGITGTQGKSTTSMLLAAIIESASCRVGIANSLGFCDGDNTEDAVSPAPTAPEFVRWLTAMRDHHCSHAVIEAASEGLARHSFAGMQLDAAVITNVRRDHLDIHGTIRAYRETKKRLLNYLKPKGFAVVNIDDPGTRFIVDDIEHPVLTVGLREQAEITASVLEQHLGEQTFLLQAGSESIPVCTKIVGTNHIYNCLQAAAVGLVYGFDLPTIARGLEAVTGLPGRMERVNPGGELATYVDAGKSPGSLIAALQTLRQVTDGRVICVYGAEGGRLVDERPLLGRAVERNADLGIITRSNPGTEDQNQIAHDILDGYDRPAVAHLIPDRGRAIGWALHQARPGDSVLIAGRGNEIHEIVDGNQIDFDDREVARFFLRQLDQPRALRKSA